MMQLVNLLLIFIIERFKDEDILLNAINSL